jgi:hypothetical protein
MKKHNKFESVMLTDYFQGILDGQISIEDLKNEDISLGQQASLHIGSPHAFIEDAEDTNNAQEEIVKNDRTQDTGDKKLQYKNMENPRNLFQ